MGETDATSVIRATSRAASSRFYRITIGTLCFGALIELDPVRKARVAAVPPVASGWRGKHEAEFLAYWRDRGATIEQLDADGTALPLAEAR